MNYFHTRKHLVERMHSVGYAVLNSIDILPELTEVQKRDIWQGEGEHYIQRIISGFFAKAYIDGFDIELIVDAQIEHDLANTILRSTLKPFIPEFTDRLQPWIGPAIGRVHRGIQLSFTDPRKSELSGDYILPCAYIGSCTYISFDNTGETRPHFKTLFPSQKTEILDLGPPSIELRDMYGRTAR